MPKPLTSLESAALNTIIDTHQESDGWLDLTRVCSRTGRHLGDVRQAVARIVRYGLVQIDGDAPNTERWIKFVMPSRVGGDA